MKLPIRKEFFEAIKAGKKIVEWRDAHITFVCEETGERLQKDVVAVDLVKRDDLPDELQESGLFEDDDIIAFELN
jgi:uncharacterized radical SAM superfamily protein